MRASDNPHRAGPKRSACSASRRRRPARPRPTPPMDAQGDRGAFQDSRKAGHRAAAYAPGWPDQSQDSGPRDRSARVDAPHAGGREFLRGRGCEACGQTGYSGRVGIFEILRLTPRLKDLVSRQAPESEIKSAAAATGTRFLLDDALDKVRQGFTTIEEVLRVIRIDHTDDNGHTAVAGLESIQRWVPGTSGASIPKILITSRAGAGPSRARARRRAPSATA